MEPARNVDFTFLAMIFGAIVAMFGTAVTFLKWLSNKRGAMVCCNASDRIRRIEDELKEIHDWLAVEDGDGVKKIYTRRSHDAEIQRLADMMRDLTPAMLSLANAVTRLREDL